MTEPRFVISETIEKLNKMNPDAKIVKMIGLNLDKNLSLEGGKIASDHIKDVLIKEKILKPTDNIIVSSLNEDGHTYDVIFSKKDLENDIWLVLNNRANLKMELELFLFKKDDLKTKNLKVRYDLNESVELNIENNGMFDLNSGLKIRRYNELCVYFK